MHQGQSDLCPYVTTTTLRTKSCGSFVPRLADNLLGTNNGFILIKVCDKVQPLLPINKQFWLQREEDRDQEAEARGQSYRHHETHRLVSD